MIENSETARRILTALEETCTQPRETAEMVRENCSGAEYEWH